MAAKKAPVGPLGPWVCHAELGPHLGLQSEKASGAGYAAAKSRAGAAFHRGASGLASMLRLFALVPVLTIGALSKEKARTHIRPPMEKCSITRVF